MSGLPHHLFTQRHSILNGRSPGGLPVRRGALLLLVLITGTIIAVISLGALVVQGVYLKQGSGMKDATAARWAARSGISLATKEISGQSIWRSQKAPGPWYNTVTLGNGTWSLNASDPTDTSFSDNVLDPVLLSAIGRTGDAIQKIDSLCLPETILRQPLMFLACCHDDLTFDSSTVEGNGWIGAGDSVTVSGSNVVSCDVMAGTTITGSGFQNRTLAENAVDPLPVYSDFNDLVSLGTSVTSSAVPAAVASTAETILNGDFNRGDVGWQASPTGSLTSSPYGGVSNSSCVTVIGRTTSAGGLVHDVTGIIRNGRQTQISAAVYPIYLASPFELSLIVTTTTGISTAASWTSSSISAGPTYSAIQSISTTVTPSWTGRLISAQLKIRTSSSGTAGIQNFVVDNVSMKITSAPSGKAIYRKVISTTTNPFGGSNNSYGIFVLDCGGADLTISDCMITGTLIVHNVGTVRIGDGPIQWRPAKPGMPALVVDGKLILSFSRFALTERELGVNLNPAGSPDENGSTDSSQNDSYVPALRGLVFASDDITVSGDVSIFGCLLAGDDMIFRQRATLRLAPQYLTVPGTATHRTESFLRETTGVTRSFD